MSPATILYAPNVHTGGGLVLLRGLLREWERGQPLCAFLDARVRGTLEIPASVTVYWVEARFAARFAAQRRLRALSAPATTVLCFNGLPPLLGNPGRIVVFLQNRLHLVDLPRGQFAPRVALRLACERFASRALRHRVHRYVVQTPSMARALTRWYCADGAAAPLVAIVPFADVMAPSSTAAPAGSRREGDFIYVADGLPHKNHLTLFAAWALLAEQGIRPRLTLTLAPGDTHLFDEIGRLRASAHVDIHNLGQLAHADVLAAYARARALVFPSTEESFGLPLVEARQLDVPIIASERDFVRDVCAPAETFDPQSPVSIARAIRRFLGHPEAVAAINGPRALWDCVLSEGR